MSVAWQITRFVWISQAVYTDRDKPRLEPVCGTLHLSQFSRVVLAESRGGAWLPYLAVPLSKVSAQRSTNRRRSRSHGLRFRQEEPVPSKVKISWRNSPKPVPRVIGFVCVSPVESRASPHPAPTGQLWLSAGRFRQGHEDTRLTFNMESE